MFGTALLHCDHELVMGLSPSDQLDVDTSEVSREALFQALSRCIVDGVTDEDRNQLTFGYDSLSYRCYRRFEEIVRCDIEPIVDDSDVLAASNGQAVDRRVLVRPGDFDAANALRRSIHGSDGLINWSASAECRYCSQPLGDRPGWHDSHRPRSQCRYLLRRHEKIAVVRQQDDFLAGRGIHCPQELLDARVHRLPAVDDGGDAYRPKCLRDTGSARHGQHRDSR